MKTYRPIASTLSGKKSIDGAGVHLKRIFGFQNLPEFDPFLLLDHFGSDNPDDYMAGFPWHPHRGIETVTYMLNGSVDHSDSLGNIDTIHSGEIQWMTAGSGIIHQEMPCLTEGLMQGFQLWINLPSKQKMIPPRYRGILSDEIPQHQSGDSLIKVIAGSYNGIEGPVKDIIVPVHFLDVTIKPNGKFTYTIPENFTLFVYVFEGKGTFDQSNSEIHSGTCLRFADSTEEFVEVTTKDSMVRFIIVAGKPLHEPISWCGPIVMNTQSECNVALREYEMGTFIKKM